MKRLPERPANPWGDSLVVWREEIENDVDSDDPYRLFHELLADPTRSHLVREIAVNIRAFNIKGSPETMTQAEVAVEIADKEFDLLDSIGIEVARPDWHIADRGEDPPLILARVPIVDGKHPTEDGPNGSHIPFEAMSELNSQLDHYLQYAHKPGEPFLSDIEHGDQFVYGAYRYPERVGKSVPIQPILIDPDIIIKTMP